MPVRSANCSPARIEITPPRAYSGTINLYVGYTTDGTVKAGDAANDVNLSQLACYEVTVNLSVGHVHTPDTAWSSDADGHWHTCSGCADKLDYETHAPKTVNAKAATCTEDGYTGDTVCSVCGYKISRGESVPATGHDWGEWAVSEPATCTDDGVEKRTCTICGSAEERTLPALGHDFQDGACARCGEKDPDYVAPAGTDEPQKPESERTEVPDAGDASLPALAAAVAGSLLCLVAVPRLCRR